MKKLTKCALSLTLVLVMVLSLGLTCVAADNLETAISPEDYQALLDKWNSILSPETPFTSLDFFAPDESSIPVADGESVEYEFLYLDEMSDEEIGTAIGRILNGENILLRETRNGIVTNDGMNGIAPARWSAGANGTHQWITTWALNYLYQCGLLYSYNERLSATERANLISYSDWPDTHEPGYYIFWIIPINDWHFYHYQTKMNFFNNANGSDNAKTRFVYWYVQAVSAYKAGSTATAFQNLGKAIHYLSDLNTPVHTGDRNYGDVVAQLNKHATFENRADANKNNVRRMPTNPNLSGYETISISTMAEQAAAFSFNQYLNLGDSEANHQTIYSTTLNSSIMDVMGLLQRFWYDTDGLYRH